MENLLKNFTLVKNTTKKGKLIKDIAPIYNNLWDCYKSYSYAKQRAYNYCKSLEEKYQGFDGGIHSYCINNFTYTFTFEYEGKKYKAWITKTYNYLVEL